MNTKEKTTEPVVNKEKNLSMMVSIDEIEREAYPVLSKMYEQVDETPENSLLGFATRLTNVAHSYIEKREQAYLDNELENEVRGVSSDAIDAVCRLANEARQNIKLAMDIKKEKSKMMIDLIKVMRK